MELLELRNKLNLYELENDLEFFINDGDRKNIIQKLKRMSKEEQEQEINDLIISGLVVKK